MGERRRSRPSKPEAPTSSSPIWRCPTSTECRSERIAVAAMKAGAYDYLPKPFDPDELALAVRRGLETRELRLQNARLRTEAAIGRPITAESPALKRVLDMVH